MLSVVPRLDRTIVRQDAARVLREALARVESGETVSVAVVEQSDFDEVRVVCSGSMDVHKLVYGLESVKHSVLSELSR